MSFLEYVGIGAIVGLCILLASLVVAKCLGEMNGDYDEEQAKRDVDRLIRNANRPMTIDADIVEVKRPRVRAITN